MATTPLHDIQGKAEGEKEPAKLLGEATTDRAPIVVKPPFKLPPQDRKEDSGDSGHSSGSGSKGLKQARSLPNITLQTRTSSTQLSSTITPSATTPLGALGDSVKDSPGPSKAIVPQESLQAVDEDKPIFNTETEEGTPELKHKWSWMKGKSVKRAMGRGFRDVLDALKDGSKAGDTWKGKDVAK